MDLQGLKSIVLALFTPSVDRIVASFARTQRKLERAAEVNTARGRKMLEASDAARRAAGEAFAEVERAERIKKFLEQFTK